MKIRSIVPFPLGPNDIITRDAAMRMIGQKAPAKVDGKVVGESTIIDVDWRDSNDVLLTIEMEIESNG